MNSVRHWQPSVDALKQEMLSHRVLHADETPVAMLKPGNGKTHRAYLWAYYPDAFEDLRAVVYDFCESRAGEHARHFLATGTEQAWQGHLMCDDYSAYKALFTQGISEAGCMAHPSQSTPANSPREQRGYELGCDQGSNLWIRLTASHQLGKSTLFKAQLAVGKQASRDAKGIGRQVAVKSIHGLHLEGGTRSRCHLETLVAQLIEIPEAAVVSRGQSVGHGEHCGFKLDWKVDAED